MLPPFSKESYAQAVWKNIEVFLHLIRHPGTPESVGRGVAVGLFSALIIPAGHMLLAFLLAVLVRGARGSAVLSTWIINPLTLSVVYPVQCYLGSFMIGNPLSYALIKKLVLDAIHTPSTETVGALSRELIMSFFAGGLLMGAVAAVLGYFVTTEMARRYRTRRG